MTRSNLLTKLFFDPEKWHKSVQGLSLEATGALSEIMGAQWLNGCVPDDREKAGRMIGKDIPQNAWTQIRPMLVECRREGPYPSDPGLGLEWVERERDSALARYAAARTSGSKGGKTKQKNKRLAERQKRQG